MTIIFFRQAYDSNVRGSALAALGQNICERYLKHIISEYAIPDTNHEMREKEWILKSHSLNKLMKYIMDDMGIKIQMKQKPIWVLLTDSTLPRDIPGR